jgi:cell division protein FtsL
MSALAVIYCKYRSREIFIEIQRVERDLDDFEVKWGQLQLEMRTLAEHNRVERIAHSQLELVIPVREQIIFIKPSS